MRYGKWLLLLIACCVACSGCSSGEADKLRAQMEQLRSENQAYDSQLTKLESENAQLTDQLQDAEQKLAEIEKIKQGYEQARTKLKENLAQLGPLLGNTGSPLPPFEELSNSDWVGKFAPGGQLPTDLKALESQLKGLLGEEGMSLEGLVLREELPEEPKKP
jgi:TolA-binding protein